MSVLEYDGIRPTIGDRVFVAPGAHVIGDVHVGDDTSVWFNAVVRGDVFHIRIGARTNVQDNTVIHVTTGRHPAIIGNDVTIGHRVLLHGCTVEDGCLIGMGAIVMDRAHVGAGSLVGAGALVTEGTEIPPGVLVLGAPARVKRPLTDEEREHLATAPGHYAALAARYAGDLGFCRPSSLAREPAR